MLSPELKEDLEVFTKEIMANEGISAYDLHVEGQAEKNASYGSEIVFFSVTSKDSKKKYNLVMKTAKQLENLREVSADGSGEKREVFMYSQVFPALRKMLDESECPFQLENISKTYLVSKKHRHETVIMDNLVSLGYRPWDKKKPMELEHVKTVLTSYGKLHASSVALRHNKPEIYHELTKDMNNVWESFVDNPTFDPMFKQYITDTLKILTEDGQSDIAKKIEVVAKGPTEILAKKIDNEDKVVITHGDCWMNNMMFKYQDSECKKPTDVCFLNFQISSPRSPASDLSYFLYSSCDGQTLADEFENLLDVYYQSFSSTLKNLNVDPENALSFDKLKEHWKKYAVEGLIMATMAIKTQLANKDEHMDLTDIGKEGMDYTKFMISNIQDEEEYKKRIVGICKHYAKSCL